MKFTALYRLGFLIVSAYSNIESMYRRSMSVRWRERGREWRRSVRHTNRYEFMLLHECHITQKSDDLSFCECADDDTDDTDVLLLSLSVRFRGISTGPMCCFIGFTSTRGMVWVFGPSFFGWAVLPVIPLTKFLIFSILRLGLTKNLLAAGTLVYYSKPDRWQYPQII